MPVQGRRKMVPLALQSYLSQTWKDKELVVVDDGPDILRDLFCDIPNLVYSRCDQDLPVGHKRNICCEQANGEIIVHWDSDDWSAPERISTQIARLEEFGKAVTGYSSMLYWDGTVRLASLYTGAENYALGSSMTYYKSFWKNHQFHRTNLGEDTIFWSSAVDAQQITSVPAGQMMVARLHPGNTSPSAQEWQQFLCEKMWVIVPRDEIPQAFFDMLSL